MGAWSWRILPALTIALALPLMAPDCGGPVPGGAPDGASTTCVHNGKSYNDGDSFPAGDGCNHCSCAAGKVVCTELACQAGACTYNGKTYKDGDSFPAADGCNTCSCANGQVACTLRACNPGQCTYNGKTYNDGDTFPAADGCNTCSCNKGAVSCTKVKCPAGQWYLTCGDPVCRGHVANPNIPPCTTQSAGSPCPTLGQTCDPNDACNAHLICATSDPTMQPGGCPKSLARFKTEITYLNDAERARSLDELLRIQLATYRYRSGGPQAPRQLGFIIDDLGKSPAVNPDGESVNLYGYTSLAVAALQEQQKQIEALRREIESLKHPAKRSYRH